MTRWKLTIEYDGTHFCGWQRQDGVPTVQQTLEEAIEKFSGEASVRMRDSSSLKVISSVQCGFMYFTGYGIVNICTNSNINNQGEPRVVHRNNTCCAI